MIIRPTARLIALDPNGRVLLFQCRDGSWDDLFWITPGGGVEPGETFEQAALRELLEETGIDARSPIGPCVLESEAVGRHADYGNQKIIYRDRTFSLRLTEAEVAQLDPATVERSGYVAHRWWSLGELDAATAPVYPEGLGGCHPTHLAIVRRPKPRTRVARSCTNRTDDIGQDEARPPNGRSSSCR